MGKNTAMSQEQALRIFQGCDQVKLNLQKQKSQLHPSKTTNQTNEQKMGMSEDAGDLDPYFTRDSPQSCTPTEL